MAEGDTRRWAYDASLAAAATAAALLARWAADPLLGDRLQFLTFFGAVVLAGAMRGRRCGILATAMSAVAGMYLFMPPRWVMWPRDLPDLVAVLLFTVVASFVALVAGGMHETRQRSVRMLIERRQAEDQLRSVVESSANALIMTDAQGIIVLVNAQAERCFGYDRKEMIGRRVEMLVPERFRGQHPDYRQGFMAEPLARPMGAGRDLFGRRKDGSEVPVEIGLSPIHTDRGVFVLASIVDITERMRAHETLKMIVEAAPNALVMADGEGRIVLANSQAEKCFGYTRQELIGRPVEVLVPERFREGHPAYRHGFMADPRARPMGAGRDLFGRRKDGTEVPVEIGLSPIHTDGGVFVLASIVDITERKRAEEAVHRAAEELRRSNLDLEQFAYVASHDLQEPLRQVSGFVQLLHDRYAGKFDKDADEYLAFAIDGAKRMSALIKGLLEYSRAGTRAQAPQPVSAEEAFVVAMENLRNAALEAGAKITYDSLPVVQASLIQLTQVFQNLIGNAIKFRREGAAPEIHIGCRRDGSMWRLSVSDNGIGIPADQVDRMFQVFQRLHGRDKYPGTGIGLAICKKIVERYGGRIWVDSSQKGTTFYFTLPAAEASP